MIPPKVLKIEEDLRNNNLNNKEIIYLKNVLWNLEKLANGDKRNKLNN